MNKFDDLEKRALALPASDTAALARTLIDGLDRSEDEGVEQLWIEEARRRYDAYQRGETPGIGGDEAMARARSRLR